LVREGNLKSPEHSGWGYAEGVLGMGQIIGLLIVGLIIGAVARLIKPGRQTLGIAVTMLLGVVGALIGGWLASLMGRGSITELNFVGFILAVVVAVLLIGLAEGTMGRRRV
jgi:uncharacterized membrane protein YeaQ/YmgE (transglycosylase-associated protein family)